MKEVIERQNAEFPAAQLKLIHSGQILKDDSTLADYKIKEEEFLVCMVTKVRSENLPCPAKRTKGYLAACSRVGHRGVGFPLSRVFLSTGEEVPCVHDVVGCQNDRRTTLNACIVR